MATCHIAPSSALRCEREWAKGMGAGQFRFHGAWACGGDMGRVGVSWFFRLQTCLALVEQDLIHRRPQYAWNRI